MSHWITGKVVAHKHWNEYLHTLYIEADIGNFQAGQFVKVGLDIKGEIVGHAYSLVNPPEQQPLEILYIEVPQGQLSPRFAQLQPGDNVHISHAANGFMVLDEVPASKNLWLLATGTGVGPYLSMLGTEKAWQQYEKIVLVYAVRLQKDLVYQEKIAEISAQYPERFIFVPFVSRESMEGALSGRIPQAIEDGRLEEKVGIRIHPDTCQFILCGNPDMVAETQQILQQRGLKKHRRRHPGHITTETYW